MFLHHLNSLGLFNRITEAELERTRRRLQKIREETLFADPGRIQNISMRICAVNLKELSAAGIESGNVYRETGPRCWRITIIFKWFCFDSALRHEAVREEYLSLKNHLDSLVEKNCKAMANRSLSLIANYDEVDDPVELAILFIYGCERNYNQDSLKQVYKRIIAFAEQGKYRLRMLRNIARSSRKLFHGYERDVKVRAGHATFTFHGLLLKNQCGVLRGEIAARRYFYLSCPDERIFRLIHRFIQYGEQPDFDHVGEQGVYQYLSLCQSLEISEKLAFPAIRWLSLHGSLFKFKAKPEGLAVSCLVEPSLNVLRKLAYIDSFCSIVSLDISSCSRALDDALHFIGKFCPDIRKLSCRPSDKVAASSWKALFDLPSFKILQLDVVGIDQDPLALKKAVSEHARPLKIRLINHDLLPTDRLLSIALAIPNLSLLKLDMRNDFTLGEIQKLFEKHPGLKIRYNNRSFKDYHTFYIHTRN